MRRTVAGDSSIWLRSVRPSVSVGVARPTLRARTVARAPARIPQGRANSSRPCLGGSAMPPAAPAFGGIDVAKAELVIAIRPSGDRRTVANDEAASRHCSRACASTPRRSSWWRPLADTSAPPSPPSRRPGSRWSWPTRAKSVTSLGPPANSPKPIGSMPIPWRSLRSACVHDPVAHHLVDGALVAVADGSDRCREISLRDRMGQGRSGSHLVSSIPPLKMVRF